MKQFKLAIDIDPSYVKAHENIARALNFEGKSDLAFQKYSEILKEFPDTAAVDTHVDIALLLLKRRRFDEAMTHFRKALEADPSRPFSITLLSEIHAARSEGTLTAAKAIAILREAAQLQPKSPALHGNLAEMLMDAGNVDEAIVHYRRLAELAPANAAVHRCLADALMQKGNVDEAIEHYQRVVELEPANAAVHNLLADLLQKRGKMSQAIEQYRKTLAFSPNDASAYNDLGSTLAQQGKIDEAVECFRKALKIDPAFAQAHATLGSLLYLQGRRQEGIAQWLEAIRLEPDTVPFLNVAAWALAASPDADGRDGAKALELARRAVQLTARREPFPLDALAAAQAETGQYAKAVETARAAQTAALQQHNAALAQGIADRIKLYENKRPFRDQNLAAPPTRKP